MQHHESADVGGDGLRTPLVEDRGHETARWFAYQYSCTAQELLRMLREPIPWVRCEWHTDFICAGTRGNVPHQLISVKHRQSSQGPWALADLYEKGGLKTLYERWKKSGRQHLCRMMTNAGLKSGKNNAGALKKVLDVGNASSEFAEQLTAYADLMHAGLAAESKEDVVSFLKSLTIVTTAGDEYSMQAYVIDQVARPILLELGLNAGYARASYKAALDLVEEAVQGLDPNTPTTDWLTSGPDSTDSQIELRTVTMQKLVDKLAASGVPILIGDLNIASVPVSTAMARKLRAGGLGPTILSSAPRLRRRWYEVEVGFRSDLPSVFADEIRRLRAEVVDRAGQAESATREVARVYGQTMHTTLSHLLADEAIAPKVPVGHAELMGCAYQLTDECEIWWSDLFDATREAPWVPTPEQIPSFEPENLIADLEEAGPPHAE